MPRPLSVLVLVVLSLMLLAPRCANAPRPLHFSAPAAGQLSLPGPVDLRLELPRGADPASIEVTLDGVSLPPASLTIAGGTVSAVLDVAGEGVHEVSAQVRVGRAAFSGSSRFVVAALDRPDECELLNQVSCVLPYPSSRFLEPAPTETGFRMNFGAGTLPSFARLAPPLGVGPIDPTPFLANDGFSPTGSVLVHFPQGVDLAASDAPRLDPGTRTYDDRGLDPDSPTLLIEWESGAAVNHFVEHDIRPNAAPGRVLTLLRPGEALLPGRRYVVAMRNLVAPGGAPVEAEPVFANVRDRAPSTVPGVEAARRRLEPVFDRLSRLGVAREELVLAFDFVVASDRSLTHEMLAMRDQALAWVDAQHAAGTPTFSVDQVTDRNPGCTDPSISVWREIRGRFQVPLFLERDPFLEREEPATLVRDASGTPVWTALTSAPYGLAIPCAAFAGQPTATLLLGHGLFGDGPGMVSSVAASGGLSGLPLVAAGTNWSGLSREELQPNLFQSFIFKVNGNPDLFPALPDRLRQGQTHALVLARMLKDGHFNKHPSFQVPGSGGLGVIDPAAPTHYLGISLGGVMGTFHAALSPDIVRYNVDVPGVDFPFLLYRSTQFSPFETLQAALNDDSMDQHIAISLTGELWTRGEPSGYINHISGNVLPPLPGVPPKQMLVTAALHDQQVANLSSQMLARSLRIGALAGSVWRGLPGIPDVPGPAGSAFVMYDTGALDATDPAHLPFVPPLGNEQAVQSRCDPHGQRTGIPASLAQLEGFFERGVVENHCTDDGLCNASEPFEINGGAAVPCNPVP